MLPDVVKREKHPFRGLTRGNPCYECGQKYKSRIHSGHGFYLYDKDAKPRRSKDPDCTTCNDPRMNGGPDHDPSSHCESGKRPHCSCDTCF